MLSGKAARAHLRAHGGGGPRRGAPSSATGPNVAARALRTGVARSVALVVPDITNPFFGRVLRGAQRAAQGAGYTVVLVDIGNDRAWEAASLQALLAGPADGLLLFEADLPPGATEHAIQIEMCPGGLPVVRLDVEAGVDSRARPPARARPHADRPPRLELRRADVRPAPRAHAARGSAARRRRRTRRSRSRARRATAARPLLERGRHRGLLRRRHPRRRRLPRRARTRASRSPRTCRVVGFDDLDFARVLAPPLTTVAVDAEAPRRGGVRGAGARPRGRPRRRPSRSSRSRCACASRPRRRARRVRSSFVTLRHTYYARIRIDDAAIDAGSPDSPRRARAVRGLRGRGGRRADRAREPAVVLLVARQAARRRPAAFSHGLERPQPAAPARSRRRRTATLGRPARRHAPVRRPRLPPRRHHRRRPPDRR